MAGACSVVVAMMVSGLRVKVIAEDVREPPVHFGALIKKGERARL